MSTSAPFPVTVHPYGSPTAGSCAYEIGESSNPNTLVFIGGLGDGPHSVQYVRIVAQRLIQAKELGYSLFELRLRSSFNGFGTASLQSDVADISALVKYLRSIGKQKIVLFGHSTGCQDCAEYTNYAKHGNSPVDGFILQAPISDREGFENFVPDIDTSIGVAETMISEGKADDYVPKAFSPAVLGAPLTAYRLHSLLAKGGDDDYFSSDLDDTTVQQIWSRFNRPVLVLHSGEDEYVPSYVDQRKLNDRYKAAGPQVSPLSDLIPGTGHTVLQEEAREWLGERIVKFLATLN